MDADLCLGDNLILFRCFEKKKLFRHASSYNVHVYQFLSKSGWYVDQSKTVHTIYLQIIASCINLQLPIVIWKKMKNFRHAS